MSADAGIVAPVPMGAWDRTTAYEKMNIVSHNGYVYMAYQDNTGHEPVSAASDSYWMLLVSGGVVSVDSAMSTTSTNPVQNKVIGEALETAKAEAQEVVTDQYNSATNYDVMGNSNGYPSFCISGDVLYKCITACVGVAPPNVTYWEATDVGTEISSLNSDLADVTKLISSASVAVTGGYAYFFKYGNGLYKFSININAAFPATAQTISMPTGYEGTESAYVVGICSDLKTPRLALAAGDSIVIYASTVTGMYVTIWYR